MEEEAKPKTENPNIDFTRTMANKEAYFNPAQVQQIIDYFYNRKQWKKFLLFLVLFRTGRRISEILGKPPYSLDGQCLSNYKGFRPCDIYHKERLIEFDILKKQPIKQKTKAGKIRSKDSLKQMYEQKTPKRSLKPIDDDLYNWLVWYIKNYNVGFEQRVFDISRFTARLWLLEACKNIGLEINLGYKRVKVRGVIRKVRVKPHLHMFRHSTAIYILKANPYDPTALIKVSKLLEHSNTDITTHYTQFNQKDMRNFLNKTFRRNEKNVK
jgi:integrase